MMRSESGILYIVATPIGNLGDISERAVTTLRDVALVAAEDTRHSRALLQHCGIDVPLMAYHDHSNEAAQERIFSLLAEGRSVALVSDAGTPLISDPGFKLVRAARRLGHRLVPIPGASAVTAALSVAGIATDRFVFEGFLAPKAGARRQQIQSLSQEPRSLVCFESSHRILATVSDLLEILGPKRELFIGREMTKRFETHFQGDLAAALAWLQADANQQKGEFVLVLAGAVEKDADQLDRDRALDMVTLLREELPLKKAVAFASQLTGVRKNALYEAALQRQERE